MLYLFIIALAVTSIVAIIAVGLAAYVQGQQRMMNKMLVEGKRRERRQQQTIEVWQSKLLEKSGAGPLYRREFTEPTNTAPPHRVVAPSQAISDLKESIESGITGSSRRGTLTSAIQRVPSSIAREFLKGVGAKPAESPVGNGILD